METRPRDPAAPTLIAGCGYAGTRLAVALAPAGPVLALVRSAASAMDLRARELPVLRADLDDAASMAFLDLPLRLDAVTYLAPPSGEGAKDLRLARFLEALGSARPAAFLYLSTTGVYGDTDGAVVDEASPTAPTEDRDRQRQDAEGRVSAWCAARGIRCVVFRVPAIYGPHRLPLDRLRRGQPVLREADSAPGNRIHVDDLVEACVAALHRPVSGVFNLSDGNAESMADFTARVARLAGLPPPRRVAWAEAQRILSPGLIAFLRTSRRVTSRRATELGWSPAYGNPDDGIRASLVEMGWDAVSGRA